jgi:hypothetical protein
MKTYNNYGAKKDHRPPCNNRKRHSDHLQKEGEETVQFVVQGRETFMVTCQMIRFDQETMQKPLEEVEQVEMVMAQIPTKALYGTPGQCHARSTVQGPRGCNKLGGG